jgi:hypothetical protein
MVIRNIPASGAVVYVIGVGRGLGALMGGLYIKAMPFLQKEVLMDYLFATDTRLIY